MSGNYVITPAFLVEKVFGPLESKGRKIRRINVNSSDYVHIRKHGRDWLDISVSMDEIKSGLFARIFGSEIWVDRGYRVGQIIATDDLDNKYTVCLLCDHITDGDECPTPTCDVRQVLKA